MGRKEGKGHLHNHGGQERAHTNEHVGACWYLGIYLCFTDYMDQQKSLATATGDIRHARHPTRTTCQPNVGSCQDICLGTCLPNMVATHHRRS